MNPVCRDSSLFQSQLLNDVCNSACRGSDVYEDWLLVQSQSTNQNRSWHVPGESTCQDSFLCQSAKCYVTHTSFTALTWIPDCVMSKVKKMFLSELLLICMENIPFFSDGYSPNGIYTCHMASTALTVACFPLPNELFHS